MTGGPVLFLDSGIGGIPYCLHFIGRNPGENVYYLADRLHFPYGGRDRGELAEILDSLVENVLHIIKPKIIVLACNTATLAALPLLREHYPQAPFVGTVPAVKPAALATKTGKIGVLGTQFTIEAPFIRELAAVHGNGEIFGVAAPELVEFVENRFSSAGEEEKRTVVRGCLDPFRAAGVDTLVLGCTHFLFLQEEFQREAAPDITVFDSVTGISRRIETLLSEYPPIKKYPAAENLLLLTGEEPPEPPWTLWAQRLGFRLALLGDI